MKGLDALKQKFSDGTKAATQFSEATKNIGKAAEEAGKGAAKASKGGLKQFMGSIMRIAKYRLIRTAIRELMAAFKEGLQSAYAFSKGMAVGAGGDLAKAMDSIKGAANTMKLQLGAAFGELLTNIAPIIVAIINLITRLANALAQLFAFLGGRSGYMKAAAGGAGDLEDHLGGSAKKAKELRRQLMGFDEINRLDAPSSPSGGGGGGAAAEDYSGLFEFANFDEWVQKLAPIREAIAGLWETIKTTALAAWENIKQNIDFQAFFDSIIMIIEGVVKFVGGILAGDWAMAFDGAVKIVQGFWGSIKQLGNLGISIIGSLLDWIGNIWVSFFAWLSEKTGLDFTGIVTFIKGTLSALKQFISDIWQGVKLIVDGVIDFLAGAFTGDWERVWKGVQSIFVGVWYAIAGVLNGVANTIISVINGIISKINYIISVFGGGNGIPLLNPIATPQYATGGFPGEDGLFMANHGELVGQFSNGKTAVANNEQIVEGIKRGVYDAVMSAMSGRNSEPTEFRIFLDGKQISSAVTKGQRQMSRATGVAYG